MSDTDTGCPKVLSALERLKLTADNVSLREENARLTQWVADLQSGMTVNCVYCGFNYGPKENTPATMADILKAHVEKCPKHPLAQALARIAEMEGEALLDNEDRCRLHEHIQRQQARIVELEAHPLIMVCGTCGHKFNVDLAPVERPCPRCATPTTTGGGNLSEYLFNISPNQEDGDGDEEITHWLVLVKKSYWAEHHHLDDRHLTAADPKLNEAMLGLGLAECMESTFDLYGDSEVNEQMAQGVAELPDKLRALGMSTDPELAEFMRTHHP